MSNTRVAAVIFIMKDDQILGVSRGEDLTDWGLPGGGVEEGEVPVVGAARELREETGLLGSGFVEIYSQTNYHNKHVIAFKPSAVIGNIKRSDEGEVKWCSKEELMAGTFGDYNRALFEHLNLI